MQSIDLGREVGKNLRRYTSLDPFGRHIGSSETRVRRADIPGRVEGSHRRQQLVEESGPAAHLRTGIRL